MTAGGPRKNSGRKKVEDKKVPIAMNLYIRQSRVEKLGIDKVKEIIETYREKASDAIEKEYKKQFKTKPLNQ